MEFSCTYGPVKDTDDTPLITSLVVESSIRFIEKSNVMFSHGEKIRSDQIISDQIRVVLVDLKMGDDNQLALGALYSCMVFLFRSNYLYTLCVIFSRSNNTKRNANKPLSVLNPYFFLLCTAQFNK